MKSVGIRDFRDHATKYLSGSETVAVSKHGRVVGIYMPFKRDQARTERVLEHVRQTVAHFRHGTGLSENELADLLDPKKAFPEEYELPQALETKTPTGQE